MRKNRMQQDHRDLHALTQKFTQQPMRSKKPLHYFDFRSGASLMMKNKEFLDVFTTSNVVFRKLIRPA